MDTPMTLIPQPTSAPPTEEELQARITRVQEKITARGYDCYVSFDPVNIYYLTNFANYVHERPFILIQFLPRTPFNLMEQQLASKLYSNLNVVS